MPNLSGIQQYDDPADPYGKQRTRIARNLALSQALQQKGMQPLETNRMSGGWAIPISPFEGLANLAQTYVGVKAGQKAETERGELGVQARTDRQAALAKALGSIGLPPETVAGIAEAATLPGNDALIPMLIANAKKQAWLDRVGQGGTPQIPASPAGMGPRQEFLSQQQGQSPAIDFNNPELYLDAPTGGVEFLKQQAQRNEAMGSPQFTGGPQPRGYLPTKGGGVRYLPPDITPRDKIISENLGGQIQYRTEYSPTPIGQPIQKTPTIGEQTGQRNQEVQEAELARKGVPIPPRPAPQPIPQAQPPQPQPQGMPAPQPAGQQQIPPPTPEPQVRSMTPQPVISGTPLAQNEPRRSYSQAPGPIPGGAPMAPTGVTLEARQNLAAERAKDQPKALERVQQARRVADNVLSKVNDAITGTDWKTAGFVGSISRAVPGTPAFDLARKVDTIKANIGFQELQQMRAMSPTGGALGQVAIQELEMLQATVASLDTAQSPDQLRKHLNDIKAHFERWRGTVDQNYSNLYGAPKAPAGAAPAAGEPSVDDLLKQYGDPKP